MSSEQIAEIIYDLEFLRDSVQKLTAENTGLKQKIERMNEIFLNTQHARFGQSREKRSYNASKFRAIKLFKQAEVVQNAKEPTSTNETFTVEEHTRKKKRTVNELTEGVTYRGNTDWSSR